MKKLVAQVTALYSRLQLSPEGRAALVEIWGHLGTCVLSLLVPTAILYLAIYALVRKRVAVFETLSWLSIGVFLLSSWAVVVDCSVVRSLQLFGGRHLTRPSSLLFMGFRFKRIRAGADADTNRNVVAIGVMKALDLYARRHFPPQYAYEVRPSDAMLALYYLTELRYESFTPSHVHTAPAPWTSENSTTEPTAAEKARAKAKARARARIRRAWPAIKLDFSEPANLVIHGALFGVLQAGFSQFNAAVLALQILLAIYVLWESLQLLLRYRTSPPLFGPIYKASSLSTFWGETWHSAFASPCRSLAYGPLRYRLPPHGVPEDFARGIGIIASFALMGFFHVYALAPLLPIDAQARICAFFLVNGVGTVIEDALWGKREHWVKALLAWVFELGVASWTVEGLSVPHGLRNIEWSSLCDVKKDV